MPQQRDLPIDEVVPEIASTLGAGRSAVVVAPPGAGKTTGVPLALLDAPWLAGRKLLLLEPRRLAARAAAERMASLLGERVGERIGLRSRLDTRVSARTRIEVVTEGVFTRLIQSDPELTGVGAILFDEFHERSLDADLGLALALDARAGLREDLRILVMSATIDGAQVAQLLGDAPVIVSEGRAFPVDTRYLGQSGARIEERMADAVRSALTYENGSILAFLPGQGEIVRTADLLSTRALPSDVDIVTLFGALDAREQARAIAPAPAGRRKVVLATSIAETSITIDGVRFVIDSGLERVPRYEPDVGITRLVTQRVSRASADQRRGRAGRTEPGVCLRLWDEPQTAGLLPFREPEIKAADLSGLLLDCAAWGVADPGTLSWLDPPPSGAVAAARSELLTLGALDDGGALTEIGRRLRRLPLPPRLARMILAAAETGHASRAAEIAAVLVERGMGGNTTDLDQRVSNFARDRSRRAGDMRGLARGWAQEGARDTPKQRPPSIDAPSNAALLAQAFPDRIAKARGAPGQFLLANGRAASLDPADPLALAPYLVVAEVAGAAARARILVAAATSEAEVRTFAVDRIRLMEETAFEPEGAVVRTRRTERLGAIVLRSEPRPTRPSAEVATLLAQGIAGLGIGWLPWSRAQLQLRARIAFVRAAAKQGAHDWPDLSDAALAATADEWLAPFLSNATSLGDIDANLLGAALDALLPWSVRQNLDALAPVEFTAPTGRHHPIDYEGEGAPILAIRVQELFGLDVHPAIANGRLPLTLHLLSPAHRPIQITRDLPGFWSGSWADVRADMRGRYPKYPWPEDPRTAPPTSRAKPRGT
jgi:ATP-dependent helicase HrpB